MQRGANTMTHARAFLSGLLFFIAVLLFAPSLSMAESASTDTSVGKVVEMAMWAHGTPPGGKRVRKEVNASIVKDETLETGMFSSLTAQLKDGTKLVLSADSRLVVDDYVYDPTGKQAAVYTLTQGVFFYATGKMKKDVIAINTPVATIGIRGTELVIHVDPSGRTEVGVVSGKISVRSRGESSGWSAEKGSTLSVSKEGKVEGVRKGVEKTGDEEIDKEIPDGEDVTSLPKGKEEDDLMAQFQKDGEEEVKKKRSKEESRTEDSVRTGDEDAVGEKKKRKESKESSLDSDAEAADKAAEGDKGETETAARDGDPVEEGSQSSSEGDGESGTSSEGSESESASSGESASSESAGSESSGGERSSERHSSSDGRRD